jgi:hypothetical protein
MGRRELGDYSGKFNRKREFSIFDASTGVSAFLFLKKGGIFGARPVHPSVLLLRTSASGSLRLREADFFEKVNLFDFTLLKHGSGDSSGDNG